MLVPIQRTSVYRFKSDAKIATKFANYINESGWEILAQRRTIARICVLLKAYNWAGLENKRGYTAIYHATKVGTIIIKELVITNKVQMLVNIYS